jgi:hypothetical protein
MGPNAMLSMFVFHGNSAPFWNTTIRSGPGSAFGLPGPHSISSSR